MPREELGISLKTYFSRSAECTFSGYIIDTSDLARKFVVVLLIDGEPVQSQIANFYSSGMDGNYIGDGCYGFEFTLSESAVSNGAIVEARIANLGTPIGRAINIDAKLSPPFSATAGELQWIGGLRFTGWLAEKGASARYADILVDGELVMRVGASGWTQVESGVDAPQAARAFDFHVPDRFADARVHRISMVTSDGETFGGTLSFLAVGGGLQSALSRVAASAPEQLQGELFDRINPMSVPFSRYQEWREGLPSPQPSPSQLKCAVVIIGDANMERTVESLQNQTHLDWIAAAVPTTDSAVAFDDDHIRTFLNEDGQDCDFIIFGLAGTSLESTAIARISAAFDELKMLVSSTVTSIWLPKMGPSGRSH